jgi:hypothetical protein
MSNEITHNDDDSIAQPTESSHLNRQNIVLLTTAYLANGLRKDLDVPLPLLFPGGIADGESEGPCNK